VGFEQTVSHENRRVPPQAQGRARHRRWPAQGKSHAFPPAARREWQVNAPCNTCISDIHVGQQVNAPCNTCISDIHVGPQDARVAVIYQEDR